jgi:transcriptional regulator with XRE-family HTH domain
MFDLADLGKRIARRRRELRLTQAELAQRAGLSRATIAALETGKLGELGMNKGARLLDTLNLELRVSEANRGRPTLEDLQRENHA